MQVLESDFCLQNPINNLPVMTQAQGSIVPGSGLRNMKNEVFLTVNPLSRYIKIIKTKTFSIRLDLNFPILFL